MQKKSDNYYGGEKKRKNRENHVIEIAEERKERHSKNTNQVNHSFAYGQGRMCPVCTIAWKNLQYPYDHWCHT